jgi:hypothetical protein
MSNTVAQQRADAIASGYYLEGISTCRETWTKIIMADDGTRYVGKYVRYIDVEATDEEVATYKDSIERTWFLNGTVHAVN